MNDSSNNTTTTTSAVVNSTTSSFSSSSSNSSNGSSGSHTGLVYPIWEAVLISIICTLIIIGTIIGNVLVCTAVGIVKKLRTPSNLLIVSLAVADLLVAIAVMPLALVYKLMGAWKLGQELCDMWTSLDVLLCTASILNLCMISVDRYFVITRPFDYAVKRTPALMALMIFSVWILSALISIPPLFGWKSDSSEERCELSQAIGYQIYATIGAFYLPLTVMIIIYYRIYAVSAKILKKEKRSASHDVRQLKSSSSFSNSSGQPRFGGRRLSSAENISSGKQSHKSRKESLESSSSSKPLHGRSSCTSEGKQEITLSNSPTTLSVPDTDSSPQPKQPRKVMKNVSFLHKAHPHGHVAKERKTTKTLGIIMGAFVICWLPFFIVALLAPLLPDPTVIPEWLFTLLQWLGFTNSFLNPIIYARFNRDFRGPFKAILLCKVRNINTYLRSERFSEEYGLPPGDPSSGRRYSHNPISSSSSSANPSKHNT